MCLFPTTFWALWDILILNFLIQYLWHWRGSVNIFWMNKCRLANFVPFSCPQSIFCGVNSALYRFGLSCCIGWKGVICMFMYMCLIVYLGQLSFCIILPSSLPQLCCLLQKINFGSNLSCPSLHGISLMFMCCFPAQHTPTPLLNRTYILCCLFCLFILERWKVQQGHYQFAGIWVLHGLLSP